MNLTYVDRCWHCVAAEPEAGLVDDTGNPISRVNLGRGLQAYHEWSQRDADIKPTDGPA